MIGIYKYTNNKNGHAYIGQSIDIKQRQYAHKSSAFNPKSSDYNSQFHQAIRKYGIDNFSFEILEEIEPSEYSASILNELEKYYIEKYDTFHNGYNASEGGEDIGPNRACNGEKNGRVKLTIQDVEYIRNCYNSHIPFREVYEEYKDKLSKRGLQKIWWFETWKTVHPEYHNEENKYYHSHEAKGTQQKGYNTRIFSEDEVRKMRELYDNGATPKQVWQECAPNHAWTTVYNIITRKTYKDIK